MLFKILCSWLVFASTASADVGTCLHQYASRLSNLKHYSATMVKTEWLDVKSAEPQIQKIHLEHDLAAKTLTLIYLDEGHSGIKNNGMHVIYDGTSTLHIALGKVRGLATLFRPIVSLAAGETMSLTDPEAIDEEIFTINRAGFSYIAELLDKKFSAGDLKPSAFTSLPSGPCDWSYKPKENSFDTMTLKPTDDIFEVEKKYGTLTYLIYLNNRDKLKKFHDLFDRDKDLTFKIPKAFTEFEIEFEGDLHVPKEFRLSYGTRKLGTYSFSDIDLSY